jgi:hypothetical protein
MSLHPQVTGPVPEETARIARLQLMPLHRELQLEALLLAFGLVLLRPILFSAVVPLSREVRALQKSHAHPKGKSL